MKPEDRRRRFRRSRPWIFIILSAILLQGCFSSRSALPLTESLPPKPLETTIFAGTGEAYRYSEGTWKKYPSYNYEFFVEQRMYGDYWETIKQLHRRHPDYDGLAGDRDQTLYFIVQFVQVSEDRIEFQAEGTLGKGAGSGDPKLKNVIVELTPSTTAFFIPFNRIRITQLRDFDKGKVGETVELFKRKDGKEIPYMKMEETADIFYSVGDPRLPKAIRGEKR